MRSHKNGLLQLFFPSATRAILGLLAALFLSPSLAQTVTVPDSAFQRFMVATTGTGKQTIGFGTTGTPVISPGVPSLATNGGPNLNFTRSGTISNPAGNPLPITATGAVPKATLGPLILKAAKLLPALSVGVALYDLFNELGFNATKNPDGTLSVQKTDPEACTTAPCYEYWASQLGGTPVWSPTASQACIPLLASINSNYPGHYLLGIDTQTNPLYGFQYKLCQINHPSYGLNNFALNQRSVSPSSSSYIQSTEQEFIDAVAARSVWPNTSKLPQAIAQAQSQTGEALLYDPATMTFTGPATSTGPTSTTTNADGTTTTKNTTYNHNYAGDTVTTTNVTTTTNNNPITNQTTITTTTETPATDQKKSDCEMTPDAIGCQIIKFDTPAGEIPKSNRTVTFAPDAAFSGVGSCPADKSITTSNGQIVLSYAQTCDALSSFVRPVILLMAGFFAVMLVAGGLKQ